MTRLNHEPTVRVAAAAMLLCGIALESYSQTSGGGALSADEIAAKSRAAYAALSSYCDSGTVASEMAGQKNTLKFNSRLQRANLYRVDWTQNLGPKGVVWSDGTGDYLSVTATGSGQAGKAERAQDMKKAFSQAAGPSWSAASTIAAVFFNQDLGDVFVAPAVAGRYPLHKDADSKVGEVDCYVLSSATDLAKQPEKSKPGTASITLWIGKKDFLIHQCRTKYIEKVSTSAAPSDKEVDDAIRRSLEMQKKPVTPEAIAAMRPQMRDIMKQVQKTLKSGFESGIVFTQTRDNIVVNKKLSPTDFAR